MGLSKLHFWNGDFGEARSVSELTLSLEVGTQMPRNTLGFSRISCARRSEMQGAEGRVTLKASLGEADF